MKRTTPDHVASNRSGNNLPPQTNEGDEVRAQNEGGWYNPKMKEKGGKVKPLTPEEMEARLFLTLASKSEIENKEIGNKKITRVQTILNIRFIKDGKNNFCCP